MKLVEGDRFDRAASRAGTAFNAGIGVDNVLAIAFGNAGNRATGRAGTATDASVTDFICHDLHLQISSILVL